MTGEGMPSKLEDIKLDVWPSDGTSPNLGDIKADVRAAAMRAG